MLPHRVYLTDAFSLAITWVRNMCSSCTKEVVSLSIKYEWYVMFFFSRKDQTAKQREHSLKMFKTRPCKVFVTGSGYRRLLW